MSYKIYITYLNTWKQTRIIDNNINLIKKFEKKKIPCDTKFSGHYKPITICKFKNNE